MKTSLSSLAIAAFAWLFSAASFADSPVWRISKGGEELYLAGSIHMLSSDDFPLPSEYDEAYARAELVVFETDITKLGKPEELQNFMPLLLYSGGKTIQDDLSPAVFTALSEHLKARGVSIDQLSGLRVGMLSTTLEIIELQRLGAAGTGVDKYYNLQALQDSKPVDKLETVESQFKVIGEMGTGREDALITHSLNELKTYSSFLKALKDAWRSGDMAVFEQEALEPMASDFPKIYQALIVNRNNAWLPKIENMLKTEEVEMVLVGALHLAGDAGLLHLLRSKGYTVEQQ